MLCKCTLFWYCNAFLCKKVRHHFRHCFVLFNFNSRLSFLLYHVNLPKREVLVTFCVSTLTNWGRVMHTCVNNLTIIGSDICLAPSHYLNWCWNLLIGPSGTDFNEISIKIHTFSFKKIYLKMSSGRWWPFCYGLHVLTLYGQVTHIYCQFMLSLV